MVAKQGICGRWHDSAENLLLTWWRHQMETFPRYWSFVRGIHRSPVNRSPVNSPLEGQWRGALMFSLICVWINGWVNNRMASDLRRYRAHYAGGGWGCEVSCGGHHRPRGRTTTGSALDGAVFDIAQILAYLVHNMSRSQLYLGFGHFGWLPSFFGQ